MEKSEELIEKYLAGNCSEEEAILVENFYLDQFVTRPLPDELSAPELVKKEIWAHIDESVSQTPKKLSIKGLIRFATAACILLSVGAYLFLKERRQQNNANNTMSVANEIKPGSNTAILTLANGQTINLGNTVKGTIAQQSGAIVIKTGNGHIAYNKNAIADNISAVQFNLITTPFGGQYQVNLPDGTKVWLNAGSSLKFPTSFSNLAERKVSLTGEAYFEVKHDPKKPFRVTTANQVTEDIGTSFNISSYADEAAIKTTLLSGSVRIFKSKSSVSVILTPGQQATLNNAGALKISAGDLEESIAWKNGKFMFNDEPLASIMNKVSRWYNVKVQYQDGQIGKKTFGGTISRFDNVTDVLHMLELTGDVHFKIQGRRIEISK